MQVVVAVCIELAKTAANILRKREPYSRHAN